MDELATKDPEQVAFIQAGIIMDMERDAKSKRCPMW
jgi:hypothetical protein